MQSLPVPAVATLFSSCVDQAIAAADMVFISVNTLTKTSGLGAGQASDLRWVEACARQVAKVATGHTIVVEKSTFPVRTAQVIKEIRLLHRLKTLEDEAFRCFPIRSFWPKVLLFVI